LRRIPGDLLELRTALLPLASALLAHQRVELAAGKAGAMLLMKGPGAAGAVRAMDQVLELIAHLGQRQGAGLGRAGLAPQRLSAALAAAPATVSGAAQAGALAKAPPAQRGGGLGGGGLLEEGLHERVFF
jgi:hypothetical protein